ncbi:NACHT domain-containing protein [Amycolatopsis sp. NPDC051102]|uniref:NACHT domain-containing protein n=1 Tax=Amycolatopsis sp. NPDC051102 TaxID=3155163 RepID=UPI00342674D4
MTEQPANRITGDVAGSAVQVGALHGDMYVGIAPPAEPVFVEPPTDWSSLPELPPKIVSLLWAQIRSAEKLPYRLRGARRPSLATVYVRQDVTTGTDLQPSDGARPLPVLDSKGRLIDVPHPPAARLTVRPPSRSMREALDGGEHLLVTGGPGQGKSTLSLRLAAEAADCWQVAGASPPLSEPVVPLRLTARELATRLELPFFEALAETIRAEYGAMLAHPLRPEDLTGRVAGCRWLLLVDGLDEVADTVVRDRLVTVLATWAADPAYRVVLTTRPIEGATLAPFQRIGAARYELLPFDEEAFRLFAEHWFSESAGDAQRFVRQIRDAHLDELVRVPLLATIAAIIFERYADRPLPDNQYELYETYLEYLRSGHSLPPGPFDTCGGELLEYLGRVRLEEDTSLSTAACRWVGERLPGLGPEALWREQLVGYLAAVGPFLFRAGDLGFLHHSFAEHLAATAKARFLPEAFAPPHPEFVELLHTAEPEERGRYARRVLLHYTRLHPVEADRLIRHLHEGGPQQHLLAARLLAWHVPAGAEIVTAFLATARAWAATTQYPGGEILAEVSRAAHHPGLVGWLQELMRDAGMPWSSRVEAAVALGTRLHNEARAEAVGTLRTIVGDAGIGVQPRLDAADALSQGGDGEREAAASGLISVLDSPSVTASQRGDAAVVLAGLGAGPRAHAIGALTGLLDDPAAPDEDLVAAAVSLLEIDVRLHERCATVFRGVLGRRSWSVEGVEEAAVALASLGPEYLRETVQALEHRFADPRLHYSDRLQSARMLTRLGPQYRTRAGALIVEFATGPAGGTVDRAYVASVLADCGPDFHGPVVEIVRSVLGDPAAGAGYRLTAGTKLAGLGPDHWPDAAQVLLDAAGHPLGTDALAMSALGSLATTGEPHKAQAVAQLRSAMNSPESTVELRCRAAAELAYLGPELHPEVLRQMIRLTAPSFPPKIRAEAWRQVRRLEPELDQQASAALIGLLGQGDGFPVYRWEVTDPDELAGVLERTMADRALSARHRSDATSLLTWRHHRYHLTAARGVAELIRDEVVPDGELAPVSRSASRLGAGPRRLIADALRAVVLCPASRPGRACAAAEAMDALDAIDDEDVLSVLRKIAIDCTADALSRCQAVILLARNGAVPLSDATGIVLGLRAEVDESDWADRVRLVVLLGVDPGEDLRALMSDRDTGFRCRQQAAVLAAEVQQALAPEVVTELRSQTEDTFLYLGWRDIAMKRLATADPRTAPASVARLRATMEDERLPVEERSYAAYMLASVDRSEGQYARRTLVRFLGDPGLTPEERGTAQWLLSDFRDDGQLTRLLLALAHDPATVSGKVRARVLNELDGDDRRSIGRALVSDRLARPATWSAEVTRWKEGPLAAAAERALLDRLAGPESLPANRIDAAVALGKLSPSWELKAAEELEKVARGRIAVGRARRELAALDPRRHRRVVADARAVLADAERPSRERAEAGSLLIALVSELPRPCRKHLEDLLDDERLASPLRLRILSELRRLDDLRAVRDDQRQPPALRRTAALTLSGYSREDRAAAAGLLHAMAVGPDCPPRLRWWAADDLAELGTRGHELGTAALESLMNDGTLQSAARRESAARLGMHRPDLRSEVLQVLRGFLTEPNPHGRVLVWRAIGDFRPEEAALGLLDMARDRTLGPVARCRAAWAAARLHRSHREAAAIVAREIAHDDHAPTHIRVSAARLLAQASDLCRAEAREVITRLTQPARTGGDKRSD